MANAAAETSSDMVMVGDKKAVEGEDIILVDDEEAGDKEGKGAPAAKADGKAEDAKPMDAVAGKEDEEEDEETIRARRREERHERKQRQQEARTRDKTELNFLRQRNEQLEKRVGNIETTTRTVQLKNGLARAQADVDAANAIISKIIDDGGKGEDMVKAMEIRDHAMEAVNYFKAQDRQAATGADAGAADDDDNAAGAGKKQSTNQALSETAINHIKDFMKDHPTYSLKGQDEYSLAVRQIDRAVRADGFDPDDKDYWDELRERVADQIAGKDGSNTRTNTNTGAETGQRKTTNTGGPQLGSSRSAGAGKVVYHVSADRKQAMIDAGVWDDPILRNKQIKQYQKWDAENK